MPMIDVYAAEGAFTDKHPLAQNLAQAVAIANAAGAGNSIRVQVLTPVNVLDREITAAARAAFG
jgi:hypothetical protein